MPYALVLPLKPINDAPLPRTAGECAHAAFFDFLARADPILAEELHACADRKANHKRFSTTRKAIRLVCSGTYTALQRLITIL